MRGGRLSIIPLFLALSLLPPAVDAAEFAGGTGEPNDPYQIATAEQLVSIHGNSSLWGKYFALVADIDLDPNIPGGKVFIEPLLSLTTGSLDGRGHRILNLRMAYQGRTSPKSIGSDAVVRDVHFEGVIIDGDVSVLTSINEGYIANCTVEGGACGVGLVLENRGYIMSCSVMAQTDGTCGLVEKNVGSILFSCVVGGLATDGGLARENSGTISDCYSTADVFGQSAAGGLVGTNSGSISRCYATGAVSVSASSDSHGCSAGGLVGENSGTISDCYALGATSATGSNYGHDYVGDAGGLIGANKGLVLHCYAAGTGGRRPDWGPLLWSRF
jgi:hypothetical protein